MSGSSPEIESLREFLARGWVIPACPLALEPDGSWSEWHQRAVVRYYLDSGAGGLAVGVHSTQFAIRDPQHDLFKSVLELASREIDKWREDPRSVREYRQERFVKIAGVCGGTDQARREAKLARELGYEAILVSMAALNEAPESVVLGHVRSVAGILPVVGFYLQPAVGGRVFSYDFWRAFCDIPQVVAIKIAPFNRYQTNDVVRAVIESGREDIALYTGNDDNIIGDLLTPFNFGGETRRICGGLLGQWGVWTRAAVELLENLKAERVSGALLEAEWLTKNAQLTDANAVVFDAAHGFAGCIPGILEILRRQGLVPSTRCLDPHEKLSSGQAAEIDRVTAAYPWLIDNAWVARHHNRWLLD